MQQKLYSTKLRLQQYRHNSLKPEKNIKKFRRNGFDIPFCCHISCHLTTTALNIPQEVSFLFFFFLFHQKSKHQLVPPTGWIHMLAESLTSLLSWWHVQLFMQKFHPSAQTGCPGKKVALGGCHWTSSHSTCVHVQQPDWKSSCHLVESWKCHSCTLCLSWGQLLAPKAN